MSLVKFQVAEKRAAEYSGPHEDDLLLDSSSTATDSMGETDDLTAEFRAWRAETPATDLINLEEVSQAEDGVMSMVFSIDSRKFQLRCPGNYPHYEDDNFFVEAPSSLQLWCNALNEFLLDSSGIVQCQLYASVTNQFDFRQPEAGCHII